MNFTDIWTNYRSMHRAVKLIYWIQDHSIKITNNVTTTGCSCRAEKHKNAAATALPRTQMGGGLTALSRSRTWINGGPGAVETPAFPL